MKKTLMLLAMSGFIAFYACQSTKSENNAEATADSTSLDATATMMDQTMPVDSLPAMDSTEMVVTDSIQ